MHLCPRVPDSCPAAEVTEGPPSVFVRDPRTLTSERRTLEGDGFKSATIWLHFQKLQVVFYRK